MQENAIIGKPSDPLSFSGNLGKTSKPKTHFNSKILMMIIIVAMIILIKILVILMIMMTKNTEKPTNIVNYG